MKKIFLAIFVLFFASCSHRQYYKPENYEKLSPISSVKKEKLAKEFKHYHILKKDKNFKIIADSLGFLKIFHGDEMIFNQKFEYEILAASLDENLLIMLDALNNLNIIDIDTQQLLFSNNFGLATAISKPIKAAKFNQNLIFAPTLDGKIVVISKNNFQILKSFNLASNEFFDNILAFEVENDFLFAASSSQVISINNTFHSKTYDIKLAIKDDEFIYIFSRNGEIFKLDKNLNEIAKSKQKYAIFNAATITNDTIYASEHQGFLLKFDKNLQLLKVFKLNGTLKNSAEFKNDFLIYNAKNYELK